MYSAEYYKASDSSFMVSSYSDSKSSCHHQMLVSDKVDGGGALNLNPLEFKVFVRDFDDRQGCQINKGSTSSDGNNSEAVHHVKIQEEEKQEDNFDMFVSSLKLKIPPSAGRGEEEEEEEEEEEGMKTPTSLDQKIILSLTTPPGAPRKPKALPLKKRKANRHPRLLLDLSTDIQLLFPSLDPGGSGKINKKSRQ